MLRQKFQVSSLLEGFQDLAKGAALLLLACLLAGLRHDSSLQA